MKTKLFFISAVFAISILSSCKGKTCYECDFPGEKSGSGSWSSMPSKQTICQGEDESDDAFKERVDHYRSQGFICTEK